MVTVRRTLCTRVTATRPSTREADGIEPRNILTDGPCRSNSAAGQPREARGGVVDALGQTRSSMFHGRSTGGAQERGLECLIEVTSNLGHALIAELPEEG
jgi:hypothetical protein